MWNLCKHNPRLSGCAAGPPSLTALYGWQRCNTRYCPQKPNLQRPRSRWGRGWTLRSKFFVSIALFGMNEQLEPYWRMQPLVRGFSLLGAVGVSVWELVLLVLISPSRWVYPTGEILLCGAVGVPWLGRSASLLASFSVTREYHECCDIEDGSLLASTQMTVRIACLTAYQSGTSK